MTSYMEQTLRLSRTTIRSFHFHNSQTTDAACQRWKAALSNYNFLTKYRSGNKSVDADSLSRCGEEEGKLMTIFSNAVKAISLSVQVATESCHLIERLVVSETADDAPLQEEVPEALHWASALSSKDWHKARRERILLLI